MIWPHEGENRRDSSSHKEPRRTTASESIIHTTIMDHEIAKVAVIATNRNIAYADVAVGQTQSNFKELEHEYMHKYIS